MRNGRGKASGALPPSFLAEDETQLWQVRSVLWTEMDDFVITLVRCGDLTCRLGRSSGDRPDDQLLHSGQRAVPA